MHEPISFGLGIKIEDHPDAQTRPSQSDFAHLFTKTSNDFVLIPFVPQTHCKTHQDKNGSQLGWKNLSHLKTRCHVKSEFFSQNGQSSNAR